MLYTRVNIWLGVELEKVRNVKGLNPPPRTVRLLDFGRVLMLAKFAASSQPYVHRTLKSEPTARKCRV